MSGKILGLASLAALLMFSPQAEARRLFWWESQPRYDNVDPYDESYDPYLGSQDATVEDMFNQDQYDRYQRETRRRHRYDRGGDRYDPALYDQSYDGGLADPVTPQYNDMQPKVYKPGKPKKPKIVKTEAAKPAIETKTATVATTNSAATTAPVTANAPVATASAGDVKSDAPKQTETKTVADAVKPGKGGKVTCAKGQEIVASYGFLDISQKTCEGSSLVYSAVRGKSNFEVEVNPSNGEVTAVRKTS